MEKIRIENYRNIVILTGAGVSVASGIPPFRGPGGLWNNSDIMKFSELESFKNDPINSWQFWGEMRKKLSVSEPNVIHNLLVQIEKELDRDCNFILATQNIDGLHKKAGSCNIAELHGRIDYSRCSNDSCSSKSFYDTSTYESSLPKCSVCGEILRPDIVLFGEYPVESAIYRVKRALRDCDLFVAIGTSGVVEPASGFARGADYAGARTVYINLEPLSPSNPYFQECYIGKAEDIVPTIFEV